MERSLSEEDAGSAVCSHRSTLRDESKGELVCADCGVVLEADTLSFEAPPSANSRSLLQLNFNHPIQSRESGVFYYTCNNTKERVTRRQKEALQEMKKFAENLSLPANFSQTVESKALQLFKNPTRKKVKGEVPKNVVASCFLEVCNQNKLPISSREIAERFDCTLGRVSQVNRDLKTFSHILASKEGEGLSSSSPASILLDGAPHPLSRQTSDSRDDGDLLSVSTPVASKPKTLIPRPGSKTSQHSFMSSSAHPRSVSIHPVAHRSNEQLRSFVESFMTKFPECQAPFVQQKAKDLLHLVDLKNMASGKLPQSLAAAIVFFATKLSNPPKSWTIPNISRKLNVVPETLRTRVREIKLSLCSLGRALPMGEDIDEDNVERHAEMILKHLDSLVDLSRSDSPPFSEPSHHPPNFFMPPARNFSHRSDDDLADVEVDEAEILYSAEELRERKRLSQLTEEEEREE